MTKSLLTVLFMALACSSFSQEDKELYNDYVEEPEEPELGNEIGIDFQFSASTLGGVAGGGLKFGHCYNKNIIFGPSIRYQHSWYKSNGLNGGYSVYGGGGFIHFRLYDYLFVGTEIEILSNPINYVNPYGGRQWVPTILVGGGFSHAFNNSFRLNAGIMYDLYNSTNSPFRPGYVMKKENGALIPVVYRIAIFLPI